MHRSTRKQIAALLVLIAGLFAFSGCGSSDAPSANTVQTQTQATKETPVEKPSLVGTWTADGFLAEIGDNTIEINIVGPDSKSLYWKGTFPADGDKVVSKADTEALSASLLGSQDPEKTFVVASENEITFEMSMMGTTSTIHLKR
jgi:hypothetical protein